MDNFDQFKSWFWTLINLLIITPLFSLNRKTDVHGTWVRSNLCHSLEFLSINQHQSATININRHQSLCFRLCQSQYCSAQQCMMHMILEQMLHQENFDEGCTFCDVWSICCYDALIKRSYSLMPNQLPSGDDVNHIPTVPLDGWHTRNLPEQFHL